MSKEDAKTNNFLSRQMSFSTNNLKESRTQLSVMFTFQEIYFLNSKADLYFIHYIKLLNFY